jgi:hypothetical protein
MPNFHSISSSSLKPFVLMAIAFFCFDHVKAQDTVYAKRTLKLKNDHADTGTSDLLRLSLRALDCAHGHICCATSCGCCTERMREQLYDSIFHPFKNGIQRITVVERYGVASSHEKHPVHYLFRNTEGKLSRKWFCARVQGRQYFIQTPFEYYSAEVDSNYISLNCILVIDEVGDYHQIDLEGKLLPMAFHTEN